MKAIRWIAMAFGVILTSLYLFPIGVGEVNTKMAMAVVGIPLLLYRIAANGRGEIDKNLILLVLFASGVSLVTWLAIEVNNTNDTIYVTYIISMLVWLMGAYTLICYLRIVHPQLSVQELIYYLAAAGAMQCVIALGIEYSPYLTDFMLRIHAIDPGDLAYARKGNRMVGMGCAYDPGGIRLAAILAAMGFALKIVIADSKKIVKILYIGSFILITVVGCMISRTTIVGSVLALLYIAVKTCLSGDGYGRVVKWLGSVVFVGVIVIAYFYNTDAVFYEKIRFGFEGFFSLVEKGEWDVHSNEILMDMYIFPESMHTWLIGDGYIDTTDKDPYYIGVRYAGYYMATDVGYIRFIFYGGMLMLITFMVFLGWSAYTCADYFPRYRALFYMLYLVQLIVWLKVATDIFCVFAIFIALGTMRGHTINLEMAGHAR